MKALVIGIFIEIGILDVLLVIGCANMERMRERNERSNNQTKQ